MFNPFFSNKKGTIPITMIKEAMVETDDDGNSRIIIKCEEKDVPMDSTMKKLGKHLSIANEINEWLAENT